MKTYIYNSQNYYDDGMTTIPNKVAELVSNWLHNQTMTVLFFNNYFQNFLRTKWRSGDWTRQRVAVR